MPLTTTNRSLNLLLVHLLKQTVPGSQSICVSNSKSLQDLTKCCLHAGQGLLASNLHRGKGSLSWPPPPLLIHSCDYPINHLLLPVCSCQRGKRHTDCCSHHHRTSLKLEALLYWKPVGPSAPHRPGRVIQHQTNRTTPACRVRHQEVSRAAWNTSNS